MALIIETGAIVTNANTYVSEADARTILQAIGQDLASNTVTAEQQLLNAMNYIESFRARYTGYKNSVDQPLQWPRTSVIVDGWLAPNNTIPNELIRAQVFAAYEISQSENLQPNDSGRKISSEKLGPLSVSYFENSATDASKIYNRVLDELHPLLEASLNLVRT